MQESFLEFERPIHEMEKRLTELRSLSAKEGVDFQSEMATLEQKMAQLIQDIYSQLTPWQRVQLSRHPNRPYTRDYVDALFPDFTELRGDRRFSDDQAILGGFATWKTKKLAKIWMMC
jgi:acetyl-CoA carboxylase carboxyl transferase subunit alpha